MALLDNFLVSALTISAHALPFYQTPSVTSVKALKWFHGNPGSGPKVSPSNAYTCYNGDITTYPALDSWLSFDSLWAVNEPAIIANNPPDSDVPSYIKASVLTVARESSVNSRLILAALMQESSGRADVPCTHSGEILNCGIMQASYNSHSFNPLLPKDSIL